MVGEVGIEPTFAALSRQCLRVYKARPKANISNSPIRGVSNENRTHDSGITTRGFTTKLWTPYGNTL